MVRSLVLRMTILQTSDVTPIKGGSCRPCVEGQVHAAPFSGQSRPTNKLELVHIDLGGPLSALLGKAVHLVTVLEDSTELAVASPIHKKSDAGRVVQAWITQWELQTGTRVRRVRCHGAGELVSEAMQSYYGQRGTSLESTAAHTTHQNGKAESLNWTLVEHVRALLAESGLGPALRAEDLMSVVYTRTVRRQGTARPPHSNSSTVANLTSVSSASGSAPPTL